MNYRISRLADQDLERIWRYVATHNPEAADRVERALHAAMEQLASMPGIGHFHADVPNPRYRF